MNTNELINSISFNDEIWKTTGNTSHQYMISNYGRIISCPYTTIGCVIGKTNARLLSPVTDKRGYLNIAINNKVFKIHRLVASAFLPNPNNYNFVKHIDGNLCNNKISNLIWVPSLSGKVNCEDLPNYSLSTKSLPNEIWMPIPNTNDKYFISSFGRVLSKNKKNLILYPKTTKDGYLVVAIVQNGKRKDYLVHRLVANTFLSNDTDKEIDHIDGNRKNNSLSNLRFVTHTENINNPLTIEKYKQRKSPMSGRFGKKHPSSKPIYAINNLGEKLYFEGSRDADRKGYSYHRVQSCLHNSNKTYKGFKWFFLN